jgi:hypothetical protein
VPEIGPIQVRVEIRNETTIATRTDGRNGTMNAVIAVKAVATFLA